MVDPVAVDRRERRSLTRVTDDGAVVVRVAVVIFRRSGARSVVVEVWPARLVPRVVVARVDEVAVNATANVLDDRRVRRDREVRHDAQRRHAGRSGAVR